MKNKKVQVYLFGGLGNQIFQFYFGVYLNKVFKKSVVFNEVLISNFGNGHGARLSEILAISSISTRNKVTSKVSALLLRILIRIQKIISITPLLRTIRLYISPGTGYHYKHNELSTEERYFGYFQTWRYFDSVGGKASFYELLSSPRSAQFLEYSELIGLKKTVGIHLRRGDYSALSESFGILAKSYYEKALASLGLEEATQIFLVSDDIDFAKDFLSDVAQDSNWIYLRDAGPLDSMLLLGQCDKVCISNSTFGYWAAMLGNPSTVVAPKKWFRNLDDPTDLLPENWILISSEWQD